LSRVMIGGWGTASPGSNGIHVLRSHRLRYRVRPNRRRAREIRPGEVTGVQAVGAVAHGCGKASTGRTIPRGKEGNLAARLRLRRNDGKLNADGPGLALDRQAEDRRVMTRPDPDTASLAAAGRLLDSLARRAAVGEAVGILRGWRGRDATQALRDLAGSTGACGIGVEAARVAALVDARADGTADPDYGGWT
jgi:hypothetical protein